MREWELSYRLGMRQTNKKICLQIDACPKKLRNIFLELGELPKKRNKTILNLPKSQTFLNILKNRKQENRDIYFEFIHKMVQKNKNYEIKKIKNASGPSKFMYVHKKKQKILYLEKHRIVPGHENGNYSNLNVVLLSFEEHIMAHYLRYLQYGNRKDKIAVLLMISNSNEQIRHERAKFAGSIGGKKQQQSLKIQGRGFFSSEIQSKLGKKGANSARQNAVGAFDIKNKEKADKEWKNKYQTDNVFQEKMKKNLQQGLKTQQL